MEWLLQWRELSKRPWLLRPVLEAEGEAFVCLGGDGEKESRTSPPPPHIPQRCIYKIMWVLNACVIMGMIGIANSVVPIMVYTISFSQEVQK